MERRLPALAHPVYLCLFGTDRRFSARPNARSCGFCKARPGGHDHRSILFYESFNHRAEILTLLKDRGYLVFESDRHRAIVPETTNFIALPNDSALPVISAMAALGYPIFSPRG